MPGMLLSIDLKIRWTEMFLKQITAPSTPGEKAFQEMKCLVMQHQNLLPN